MSDLMEKVIGRAVNDAGFRNRLIEDPETALQEYNVALTPEELTQINKLSHDERTKVFEDLSARKQKMGDLVLCGNW